MKHTSRAARSAAVAVATAAATALFAVPASAATANQAHRSTSASAVFVQSDNTAGNTIVAYDRTADGGLTQAGVYSTGGLGGALAGSVVDHLSSEGSLAYDQRNQLLYAVNAGSNTITVFAVHGDRLTRTRILPSGGAFPVSIAVHGNLVYVLNALDGGSIQGYVHEGNGLVAVASWNRTLGLDPTATPQFTHTPGQISFTPDGSALVVTTKAASNSIDVFPLGGFGAPATQPVVNAEPNAVPYGFTFDQAGRLEVTEAGPGTVASFTINRDGTLTALDSAATGQAATCWIVRAGDGLYTSNAGSGTLSGFQDGVSDGALTPLGNTATDPGTVDAATTSDGRFLYVQTGADGIVDSFQVNADGTLSPTGSVTVPGAVGGEGIAVS